MRLNVALPLLWLAVAALAGCGGDATEAAPEPHTRIIAEVDGASAPSAAQHRRLEVLSGTGGGRRMTVVIGAANMTAPGPARLELAVDGRRMKAFECTRLAADPDVLVGACACRLEPDQHRFELFLRSSGGKRFRVRARSLAVIDDVGVRSRSQGELPEPLMAAALDTSSAELDDEASPLISAPLRGGPRREAPLMIVGQAVSGRAGVGGDLAAIQLNAFAGERRGLQPIDDVARAARYDALYATRGEAGERVGLTAATASGSVPLGPRAVFACACRP
jgi:hypothetical protein